MYWSFKEKLKIKASKNFRSLATLILVLIMLISSTLPISMSRQTTGTSWPMHLNNPRHTSNTTDKGPITDDVLWYNSTGGGTYSSPAVANGKVFIGSEDGSSGYGFMSCYYENNGTLAWRFRTISVIAGWYGLTSSPAVDNGYVFFGADRIYCLYENNGLIKWTVNDPGNNWYGQGTPTVANGKLFITGSDRKLYCIEQETGNVLWTFQTSSGGGSNYGLYSAPAVVNGLVYLSATDGKLYQINEDQPSSVATANHTFSMAYSSYSTPVVANGRVFVGCGYTGTGANNRFYCLDASDLSLIWQFYPGSSTSYFSSAGFYNNRIYIGSIEGNLYCLDAMSSGPTPTEYWRVSIGQTWSSPAITKDRLYIGSKTDYLYCINLSQPVTPFYYWRYYTGGDVDSSPAIYDGKVYVGTHGSGGRIYCFGSSIPLAVDNIIIEDDSHKELTTVNLNIGESVTAYAAGYNSSFSTFIEYVEVNWSGLGGSWSPGTGTSSTFTAGTVCGLYTQTGQNTGLGVLDTFDVDIMDPNPPGAPTGLQAGLVGSGKDVKLSWNASSDDGSGENDVAGYSVYRSSTGVNGTYEFSAWIPAKGSLSYNWIDKNAGDGDWNDYFYIVRANDTSNNEEQNTDIVGKVVNYLAKGWNLLSVSLIQSNTSREYVLQTLEGNYVALQSYKTIKSEPWLHWHLSKPSKLNSLTKMDNIEGYYILMLTSDYLITLGRLPQNVIIPLNTGWNLIGYPSLQSKLRDDALTSISGRYDAVYRFNPVSGREEIVQAIDLMSPGNGYWIHATEDCVLLL